MANAGVFASGKDEVACLSNFELQLFPPKLMGVGGPRKRKGERMLRDNALQQPTLMGFSGATRTAMKYATLKHCSNRI